MPKYCLDTSGISNPLAAMPEDMYPSLWEKIVFLIEARYFCCNAEIAEQYKHVEGNVGKCLRDNTKYMLFEIGKPHWNWQTYIDNVNRMIATYKEFISEYNGGRKNTIDIDDVSIVALAKTLGLPVVSMEGSDRGQTSASKMRIPRLCECEGVHHLMFNELLRNEGLKV